MLKLMKATWLHRFRQVYGDGLIEGVFWEVPEPVLPWMVVEKDSDGKVLIPWDEIDVRLPLSLAA